MNNVQLKHFRDLLAKKKRKLMEIYYYKQEAPKPKEVLKAERIIEDWKKAGDARRSTIYEQVESAILEVETQCVFGAENASVIQALNDLDNWKPQ